ncbi:MAG: transcriptional repressor [Magnetospirillum sp. WYHS-4]
MGAGPKGKPPRETTDVRPYSHVLDRLRTAGLRPTRQRLALARILFDCDHGRHVTAEILHADALNQNIRVSLATVYNTLHQFTEAGLLKEIVVDASRSYFDTGIHPHHHFFYEATGQLEDIMPEQIQIAKLPQAPDGMAIRSIELVIRLAPANQDERRSAMAAE